MAGNSTGTGANEPDASDSLKGFGGVVKAFREHAGLTQEELAPLVNFSHQTVASIEQGRRFPPLEFVERAEEVLNAFGALGRAHGICPANPAWRRGSASGRHWTGRPVVSFGGSDDWIWLWDPQRYGQGSPSSQAFSIRREDVQLLRPDNGGQCAATR